MQSRLAHFELVVDHELWMKWAATNGIDHRIISFIGFKPDILHSFNPNHNNDTYPSPRTWEFASRLIKGVKNLTSFYIPLLASVVDEAAGREFWTYAQIFETMLTIPQILANPKTVVIPKEPSVQYALTGTLGYHMNKENAN